MATKNFFKMAIATAGATLSLTAIFSNQVKAEEFTFTLENQSSRAVKQVLVSEDGEKWGYFTFDSIAPNTTGTMVWGENTNHEACEQWIKVGYEDGSVTEAAKFDFCTNPDLVVTDEPKADEPKTDEPKTDEPKADEPKTDEPK